MFYNFFDFLGSPGDFSTTVTGKTTCTYTATTNSGPTVIILKTVLSDIARQVKIECFYLKAFLACLKFIGMSLPIEQYL